MWDDDDDDDDFNFTGGEGDPPFGKRKDYRDLPVFKKAEELRKLTMMICDVIEDEKDEIRIKEQVLSNAMIIPAKIAGAEGGDLYSIRFDNATIIKLAARELLAETNLLYELVEDKYVKMLREEIEEFRIVFHDWVRSFDKTNDISDEWDIKNL